MEKSTKIIATIGPASQNILRKLYNAGMNVARLNFSHGTHASHKQAITKIRAVSKDIAIILDTKGPEIRTGDTSISITKGEKVRITNKPLKEKHLLINYKLDKAKPGTTILIDEGRIRLKLLTRGRAQSLSTGTIEPRRRVTFHGHTPHIPFLAPADKQDIQFGIKHNVDFIAASFISNAQDIHDIRKLTKNTNINIIAKIECAEAVKNRTDIAKAADGIMIARGDLGIEVNLEKVPNIQRDLITLCNELGKPVIVATQMLESMRTNPRPTRAEVADVANAILQGTDAVMLSAETATGQYPAQSVRMMTTIANEYDKHVENTLTLTKQRISQHIASAAYRAAKELDAKIIFTPTRSGYTARNVSRFKPHCPLIAITKDPTVFRQLQLSWGVTPILDTGKDNRVHRMVCDEVCKLLDTKKLRKTDKVVITAGYLAWGKTNRLEIYRGEEILEWKRSPRE